MKFLPNTIIYFHEIQNQKWFLQVLQTLIKNYNLIGLNDLEDYYYKNKPIKNACHLTFDDGDLSFYKNVFPLVKKYNIPVSVYVSPLMAVERKNFWFQEIKEYDPAILHEVIKKVTNFKNDALEDSQLKNFLKTLEIEVIQEIIRLYQKVTKIPPSSPMNMNEEQLIEIASSKLVEVGAHTLNHPLLTNEKDDVASFEIIQSVDLLSDLINKTVKSFVYPNGNYSEREVSILNKKGIKLAFTTNRGKLSKLNNPLMIPRSGSPILSNLNNNKAYVISKCLVQMVAGEDLYYKYASSWGSIISKMR